MTRDTTLARVGKLVIGSESSKRCRIDSCHLLVSME